LTGFDYTTIKLNSSGTVIWNNRYNYIGNDLPFDIDISGTNVFVNGGSQSTITDWDYAQLIYTTTGTPYDTIRTTGTGVGFDHASQAVTDVQGYVYITGAYASTSNGLDFKTIKLDQQGNIKWISTFDGLSHQDDQANSIGVDFYGNVYVTGQTKNASGNEDYCTIKYDSSGTQQWVRYYNYNNDDKANKLIVGDDNNIYITGESSNGSNKDFATIAYNIDGDTLWQIRFNGAYNNDDMATEITKEGDFVYVSGQSKINATTYQYITIAYGESTFEEIPDPFNEEPGNTWYYPNNGQLANDTGGVLSHIDFYSQNQNPAMYFNDSQVSYVFSKIDNDTATTDTLYRVDMNFMQSGIIAREPEMYPVKKTSSHYLNYYLPHCSSGVVDVYGYKSLFVDELYRGIDLYFTSNQSGAKHYFVMNKGNYSDIVMRLSGADSISHSAGTYSIHTSIGTLKYDTLVAYEVDASGAVVPNTMQPLDIYADTANGHWHFVPFTYNISNTLVIMAKQKVSATPPQNNYNINWCTYWGKEADDSFTNLTHDEDNNVIFCGNTTSFSFPQAIGMNLPDSTSNYGLSDVIIIKINDIMEPQWLTFMGGSKNEKATSIASKSNGSVICVGSTASENLPLITPPNAYLDSVPYNLNADLWLMTEFNKNGYLEWSSAFSNGIIAKDVAITQIGKGEVAFVVGEAVHSADTINVSGSTTLPSWQGGYYRNSYIMRLEGIGQRTWSSFLANKEGSANSIAINDFNQMFVAGYSQDIESPVVPGPDTSIWEPNTNVYVWMYDAQTLQAQFSDQWGTDKNEMLYDIAVDHLGNSFAVGSAEEDMVGVNYNPVDTTDFIDPDVISGDRDGMIVRHDSSGTRKWFTYFGKIGYDEVKTAIVDNDNNLYVSGLVDYNGFYAPYQQPPNFYLQPTINDLNGGYKDSYISRFNTNCELEWSTYFGTKYEDVNDQIHSLMQCNQKLYFCGEVDGGGYDSLKIPVREFDITPGSIDYFQGYSNSPFTGTEAFAGCFDTLFVSGISKIEKYKDSKLLLFPNPANEQINIKLVSNVTEFAEIIVRDNKGAVVLRSTAQFQNGINSFRLNISYLNSGLYFVSINSNHIHENTKFIKK
jgi:hypothetical protein